MECSRCRTTIASWEDLVTYLENGGMALTVHPDRRGSVDRKVTIGPSQDSRTCWVCCATCTSKVGMEVSKGMVPHQVKLLHFDLKKVTFDGKQYTGKWKALTHLHEKVSQPPLEHSTLMSSSLDVLKEFAKKFQEKASALPHPELPTSTSPLSVFSWKGLLRTGKCPREEQIEAYVTSLIANTVVVMPTGTGKTLIAALLLARMAKLSPKHMGLLIVERVPLVYQQAKVLKEETELRVMELCSENRDFSKLQELLEGKYDVLVCTAGLLINLMMTEKVLLPSLFHTIVIDECHHLTGDHPYRRVMEAAEGARWRVLALTATPLEPQKHIPLSAQLDMFLEGLPNASYFIPYSREVTEAETQFITECDSVEFRESLAVIWKELLSLLDKHGVSVHQRARSSPEDLLNLVGNVRGTLQEMQDPSADKLSAYLIAFELASLLGCRVGIPREWTFPVPLCQDDAWRLKRLKKDLKNVSPDSRVLVFVQTRECGRVLCKELAACFPSMNPTVVVGQTDPNGMTWKRDQDPAIRLFNSGKCRLLVTTSVLEEGLDVSTCDVVIRFNGADQVIPIIQSRGRARKARSIFLVYGTDEAEGKDLLSRYHGMVRECRMKQLNGAADTASIIARLDDE